MSRPKLILRDSLYIPVELLDTEEIEAKYTRHMYDDTICRQCEYFRDRHCDICDTCEYGGLKETLTFYKYESFGGTQYMGLPLGDRLNIERQARIDYDDFKFIDKRTDSKFDYPVKFTGTLRDYQLPLFNGYTEARHGIIKAPPRTGKTVTSLAILIALGRRAIIVADQVDFLSNFMEELEQYTNLPALSKKAGKKLYGFLDKPEDYENFQIGFATYQSFISKGNGTKRLKLLNKNFGSVWTDECHRGNATEYSKFISRTRCKFRGGCTATPKRKDGKHFVVENIVGPVVGETTAETLTPKMYVHITKAVPRQGAYKRGPAAWTNANKFLSTHVQRTKKILDGIKHDLNNGRSIVMGVYFKPQVAMLVEAINRMMGKKVAIAFVGGGGKKNKEERKQTILDARSGKIRVVIGIRSLMQLGLNVPRWDTLYYIAPMNNEPNWEQESRRICTPDDAGTKQSPIIRFFVDPELGQSIGCFRSTWKQSIALGHKPSKKALERVELLGINPYAGKGASNAAYADDDGGLYDSEQRDAYYNKGKKGKKPKAEKPAMKGSLFANLGR